MPIHPIARATGCTILPGILERERSVSIVDYGASPQADPVANTAAINRAIADMAERGGGEIVVPAGRFTVYTIVLRSRVNVRLDAGAVVAAAEPDPDGGGNYLEPETNPYVGLQDHAHSYLRNCLVWGDHVHDVMIHGEGRFDGSRVDPKTGVRHEVLRRGDPEMPERRDSHGHRGVWFGNKGIALLDCERVALCGFEMLMCGHFAIIATGSNDLLIDGLTIDTNRDGIDIDASTDVTVRGCRVNAAHDDAIVVKSSYGARRFQRAENILIEDCLVSGCDMGSALAGLPSRDCPVADPGCPPIGRVKLGTEATCGYDRVTIRRIRFERCMGVAVEATDGVDASNIVIEHCVMEDVTACPIFIRTGDRARYPVTGLTSDDVVAPDGDVRLDMPRWILPDRDGYDRYPARRFAPAYRRIRMDAGNGGMLDVVDPHDPLRLNPANSVRVGDAWHPIAYDENAGRYVPDMDIAINQLDRLRYGNAIGVATVASCRDLEISDIVARNVDPRYPIIVAGMMDGRIRNLTMRDIDVTCRGGIAMSDAVEQRCVRTGWTCRETDCAAGDVRIPWLADHRDAHAEAGLPRVRWSEADSRWEDDPYNVPEDVENYPEPDEFGILPAYGLYMRHADGVRVEGLRLRFDVDDTRPAIVLDDVRDAHWSDVDVRSVDGMPQLVAVTNTRKRRTGFEYVPEEPYLTTGVELEGCEGLVREDVVVDAPAPGTPPDSLYPYPTIACPDNGYAIRPDSVRGLPLTVHRPYFRPVPRRIVTVGEELACIVEARDPARPDTVPHVEARDLPAGAMFDGRILRWTPGERSVGTHRAEFSIDTVGRPVVMEVLIEVR
ncbi:right-handed parallel beta-helix repeat-containing protein [Bifidobacterium amazonense]|uniref:Right-handed parallel beta-helix repeat-containing protein n=1 Tax=Bifidobacterium amazonense TaxID=2809027 RepID=A0ABS9VXT2_9BIFI|nr:right-handed parallel beta-helix repeat-containing protein [Bifidobacterium amazonense]MCH9276862.1 right-handed parallel beta-helix repeat-containing protein [Bifidobacterium amazonense]